MPNLKVKYIIDENGDRVAPITHIDAVRNSNGDSLADLIAPEKLGFGIGVCSTSSGTALTASLTGYELVQNGIVAVTFENDVPANATLNINSKGAKPIIYKGAAIESDTIKADDTVMFAYDGTNYVVTSLGGESGGGATQEFAVISLKTDNNTDSALIGATIVITDDNTSETILSTTWSGTDIVVGIDGGVEYTITVGSVTNYNVSNTQSYTAIIGLSRYIEFVYSDANVVDLGLPSGTKWAVGNIVSDGNGGYKIGEETDFGAYFSWGNIVPHFISNGSTTDGYSFNSSTYESTIGYSINSTVYPNTAECFSPASGYDAARELLKGSWRTPTQKDYQELSDNCTSIWTTKNDIAGREFTSTINGAKIFFPAAGWINNTELQYSPTFGFYQSSSLYASGAGYCMTITSSAVTPNEARERWLGKTFRPIQ